MARPRKAGTAKSTPPKKPRRVSARKVAVKADPLAEYRQTIADQGIAQLSTLAQDECVTNIRGRVSSGSLALDRVLRGRGEPPEWRGYPLGRVTELFGPPHIGKSTLLDQACASVQRDGGVAVLLDTETSRDRHYVSRLQVDIERLQYVEFDAQETCIENVLRVANQTIDFWRVEYPDVPVVICWDALGGTATADEIEKGLVAERHTQPGAAARAMALAARLTTPRLKGSKVALLVGNHEYQNIQTGPFAGKRTETYGGSGTRHMASLRVQLHGGGEQIKGPGGEILGREIVAKIVKNRLGGTVSVTVPMLTGWGTDNVYTLYSDLRKAGVIVVSGSWASLNLDGEQLSFQGWVGLRRKIEEQPDLYARLVGVWWQRFGDGGGDADLHVSV